MKAAVSVLRCVYTAFSAVSLRDKVVIISRQANRPTVDIRLLGEALADKGVETVIMAKRLNKSFIGGVEYGFNMLRQMHHIASSRVVVVDGYCILASVLPKKEGQRIVQMWHALGAVKKFGHQTVGKPGGNSREAAEIMRLHSNYDCVIAPGQVSAGIYSEAFGIDISSIRLMGLPRIDYLLTGGRKKTRRIFEEYPQLSEKPNVLYAPTFRKNYVPDISGFLEGFDFEKYNLIIKKHWLDKGDYISISENSVIVDKKFNTMDWLKVCDKVITDYSATIFEAALLDKEIYLYLPDIDRYEAEVGLNMDFGEEAIASYVYRDSASLWEGLEKKYDVKSVRTFREKYISIDTKNCTQRLAGFLTTFLSEECENCNE